jgi:hypothetical protein
MLLGAGIGFSLHGCTAFQRPVTLVSLSPDDLTQVILIDSPLIALDRNIQVVVEDCRSRSRRTVFVTPDEGKPAGSERGIWSTDSTKFLLLGRHFFVADRGQLANGEQAYLLLDLRDGHIRCNGRDWNEADGFGMTDLQAIDWLGWTPPTPDSPLTPSPNPSGSAPRSANRVTPETDQPQ